MSYEGRSLEANETDLRLMKEARDKRDQMIRDKVPCCINCKWASVRPAFSHKDPDWFAAHYIQCTWPRLNILPSSVATPREAKDDPTMQHMAGTECRVFTSAQGE